MAAKKDDPLEKLANLIDTKINEAFESRDRQQKEASDPWARIEGVIDRAVGRHFENFAKGLDEGEGKERERKPKPEKKEGGVISALFGETEETG